MFPGSQPGPSTSPMVAIKNPKPSSSKTRTPWPLDTFWSSSTNKASSTDSQTSPVSPVLGHSYDSSTGLDSDHNLEFNHLPLTPPDSGASAFELHAAIKGAPSPRPRDQSVLVSTPAPPPVLLHGVDDPAKSPHKGRSKNDIFNSPISWLTPPSRIVPVPDAQLSPPPPPPSRNSLFFSSFGSSSPAPPSPPPPRSSSTQIKTMPVPPNPSAPQTATAAQCASPQTSTAAAAASAPSTSTSQQATGRNKGHSRNSSLGRASSEECLQEEARIRATKHVDFRLCLTNDFLLGEGRHCSVYLGSYRPRPETAIPINTADVTSSSSRSWRLCAIKRLHADRQSQLLGLEEAFALRRLGVHPNIIRLIDIRDEVEFAASPQPTPSPPPPQSRDQQGNSPSTGLGLGWGLPTSGSTSPAGHTSHSRSTSDMSGRDELLHEAQTHKRALMHDKQHEAALARGINHEHDHIPPQRTRVMTVEQTQSSILPNPTFLVQGPDGDALDSRRTTSQGQADNTHSNQTVVQRSSSTNNPKDPPRLLILLELLPNNLVLFARKHTERVDLQQWFDWALQMSEALVFLHEKGCVHADIKKENMLLTEDLEIKLCDFNSAVFPNPNDPPRDGLGLGTPAYCAPELSRATGGPGATTFSYPIDIFSLGAVLYSLATGYEPFSKARSVVEMLHRKRLFFESEENDRASRLAVEAGSNPNSQPASRSGSMRGRHHKTYSSSDNDAAAAASPSQLASSLNHLLHQYSSPPSHHHNRRDATNDSLESVASSITTISGRNPTALAVSRLLEPTDEPRGLLVDPTTTTTPSRSNSLLRDLNKAADVRRTASMGERKAFATGTAQRLQRSLNLNDNNKAVVSPSDVSSPGVVGKKSAVSKLTNLELASFRPDWLHRRSSYGDELNHHHHQHHQSLTTHQYLYPSPSIAEHSSTTQEEEADTVSTAKQSSKPSRLRAMFSSSSTGGSPSPPAGAHSSSSSSSSSSSTTTPQDPTLTLNDNEESLSYTDGHPPIILPGGGRLPDAARDMLRSMLQTDPSSRPTAIRVREMLKEMRLRI